MYVNEKAAGEVQAAEQANRKLSGLIREGCKTTRERREGFWDHEDGACAVCAAWFAFNGQRSYPSLGDFDNMAKALGIDVMVIGNASLKHSGSKLSREQVADWLEEQGY